MKFPKYLLTGPDVTASKWLGARLKLIREKREDTIDAIVRAANEGLSPVITSEQIEKIENGTFSVTAGQLHHIVVIGYGIDLLDLFEQYYDSQSRFKSSRPFKRDYWYSVRMEKRHEEEPTPFFVGEEIDHYRWAIPLRRLENQTMVTEFLELAPRRKKDAQKGVIPGQRHLGTEVIHVIHGEIIVRFPPSEKFREIPPETFHPGDRVHLNGSGEHSVRNASEKSCAFLLIVRSFVQLE